ncbi:MAG: hypothetical protein KDJ37_10405 [Hyphomicrobiaceae bacterium]|nr:hypothetical protein [Hyphomicrobiaceae bacterium]
MRVPMAIITIALSATAFAPDVTAKSSKAGWPAAKAGKGEKVCRYRFPTGEKRAWVCRKEQPCCAWDAINYVKCGSTITGCL